jgi:mRNA interferase MazF
VSRGDIWTVAGAGDYAGKPRPAVIVQDDRFDATASVTICAFTTNETDVPLARPLIVPNERNGLQQPSRIMADKITTVARRKLGRRLGRLDAQDIVRLDRALLVFLGLAGPSTTSDVGTSLA